MTNVKWIKLTTDMFDNRKVKHLRRLPEGNNIVLIWVMLLTMAGRCNAGGMIFLTENIPYTTKMLADELEFEENTIKLALASLEQLGMVSMNNDMLSIPGWEDHQNIEGMERIREQNRVRKQRQRERAKVLSLAAANDGNASRDNHAERKNDTISDNHAPSRDGHKEVTTQNKIQEGDLRYKNIDTSSLLEDLKSKFVDGVDNSVEKSEETKNDPADRMGSVPYKEIEKAYNAICTRLPRILKINGTRSKAVAARWRASPDIETFKQLFKIANESDFLCGNNERNWTADFDWLMKPQNMTKVLEGRYTPSTQSPGKADAHKSESSYDLDEFVNLAMHRSTAQPKTVADDAELRERAEKLKKQLV